MFLVGRFALLVDSLVWAASVELRGMVHVEVYPDRLLDAQMIVVHLSSLPRVQLVSQVPAEMKDELEGLNMTLTEV